MTENLLHKLEEKMVTLISEVEDLRKANQALSVEITSLKSDRAQQAEEKMLQARKLQELISLLDSTGICDAETSSATSIAA